MSLGTQPAGRQAPGLLDECDPGAAAMVEGFSRSALLLVDSPDAGLSESCRFNDLADPCGPVLALRTPSI